MFNISDFLKNFDKRTTNGICKACNASVGWSRSKLASHKRANCKGAAEDEYEIFLGKFPRKSRNKSESARISHCANTDAVKKSDSKKRNTRRVELPSGEPSGKLSLKKSLNFNLLSFFLIFGQQMVLSSKTTATSVTKL